MIIMGFRARPSGCQVASGSTVLNGAVEYGDDVVVQ